MAKLPKWNDDDDDEMLSWIGPLLPKRPNMVGPQFVRPGVPLGWAWPAMEEEALHAARQGHFKMLGYLIELGESDPADEWQPPQLTRESYTLIAAFLQEKLKAKKGPPKRTTKRRWLSNPVHAAADDVLVIENILRQHYPNERGIRARAITIAAKRANIKRGTLENHFKKPPARRLS